MNPDAVVLPETVTSARDRANKLSGSANEFAVRAGTIGGELEKAVNEALNYNKDIIDLRSTALSDYLAAPQTAEAKFGSQQLPTGEDNPDFIFDPFQREAAVARDVQTKEVPFLNYNALLSTRMGSASDIIDSAKEAFAANALAVQGEAEQSQNVYGQLLNEFLQTEDLSLKKRSQRVGEEQFNKTFDLQEKQFAADEKYRAAQLSIERARLAASGGGSPKPEDKAAAGVGAIGLAQDLIDQMRQTKTVDGKIQPFTSADVDGVMNAIIPGLKATGYTDAELTNFRSTIMQLMGVSGQAPTGAAAPTSNQSIFSKINQSFNAGKGSTPTLPGLDKGRTATNAFIQSIKGLTGNRPAQAG